VSLTHTHTDGQTVVSKIKFHHTAVIGTGSEGTSVFRGSFEGRSVAVKRLLNSSFSVAEREVKMLQQSDTHENIIRYFCTEYSRDFCYIAVELCACSLYEYVVDENFSHLRELMRPKEALYQAARGLNHLHQLNIIHRDVKPMNVLVTAPDCRGNVRALISDFGLCKKINKGDVSMTHRKGVAGTEVR
jgi:serine/threonine-protein kinase/endoribonuclease IRE1